VRTTRQLRQYKLELLTVVLSTVLSKAFLRSLEPEAHDDTFLLLLQGLLQLITLASSEQVRAVCPDANRQARSIALMRSADPVILCFTRPSTRARAPMLPRSSTGVALWTRRPSCSRR